MRTARHPAVSREFVPAWLLSERDVMADGGEIIQISREPVERTVRVVTDKPASLDFRADSLIEVIRRDQ